MFIEQLDKTRLLITLEHDDLTVFDIEPDSISLRDKETRDFFNRLLTLAAVKTGLPLKNKSITIELMPFDNGCFLLVTVSSEKLRKTYKIKKNSVSLLINFKTTADMLNCIDTLYRKGYSGYRSNLYRYMGEYYLMLFSTASFPDNIKLTALEYGNISKCSTLTEVKLNESANIIHSEDSIAYIGKAL